ncbi:MAG: hypothetical protein JWM57_1328 [Phycisphaerales bacterium]|nr:hypothetical protein [Phycisphaerales bacterium]
MGLDLLDFTFRIEKSFHVKLDLRDAWDRLPRRTPPDWTAGELHDWVMHLCSERGAAVPPSSWHRVQLVLVDVTGKSPKLIRRGTFVIRELGFSI